LLSNTSRKTIPGCWDKRSQESGVRSQESGETLSIATNLMNTKRKLWIGIFILVLLSPLGLVLPALFGAQGAWGEWGLHQIEKLVGYVPEGMRRLAGKWKAPLPEYAVPGQGQGFAGSGFGYVLSGIIGIAAIAGVTYLLTKLIVRKDDSKERK